MKKCSGWGIGEGTGFHALTRRAVFQEFRFDYLEAHWTQSFWAFIETSRVWLMKSLAVINLTFSLSPLPEGRGLRQGKAEDNPTPLIMSLLWWVLIVKLPRGCQLPMISLAHKKIAGNNKDFRSCLLPGRETKYEYYHIYKHPSCTPQQTKVGHQNCFPPCTSHTGCIWLVLNVKVGKEDTTPQTQISKLYFWAW